MKPQATSNSGLIRTLGPLMTTAIVIGTVIGSGVFKKPALVAENVPFSGAAAIIWILGGLLVLLGALAYAEVATLYPKAGGNYVFLREGYGRLFGFLWGWVEFCIIRTASIAALATIFTESLNDILTLSQSATSPVLGFWTQKSITICVILFLALVNIRGVQWGGWLQVLVTTVKVGSLLGIIALPWLAWILYQPSALAHPPKLDNLAPMWPGAWYDLNLAGLSKAFLGVLWAYHGWMNIGPIAEEVKNPQRNIPLSLLLGVGVIIFLYLGANLAYNVILPQHEMVPLNKTNTPVVSEFAFRLLGPIGTLLAAAAVMTSVFGSLNGNILVGPRLLYAMSEDGLAPTAMCRIHLRYKTPALAIAVMAAWSCFLVLAIALINQLRIFKEASDFDQLTDFAMFGAVIFETMAVFTIFIFRWRYPDAERTYRCWGYPLVPALYIVLPAFILYSTFVSRPEEALSASAFIGLGAVIYYAFGLYRAPRNPALRLGLVSKCPALGSSGDTQPPRIASGGT